MKRTAITCLLAALMLAILVPAYAQLSEDFGTSSAAWPLPNWSQLTGFYGTAPVAGTQWYQDDWLNNAAIPNKCAKLNIYGTLRNGWLITPPVAIPETGYELKFNLGFVIWNSNISPIAGQQPDDRFMILMSNSPGMTNPTILREYNNSGSPYVLDNIPAAGSTVIIPLGNITGTKYFAFYGESTVLNGDNDLMIDNLLIRPFPTDPSFHYTPSSIDFGTVMQNIPIPVQNLCITNTDAGTLHLSASDFSITGPDAPLFSFDPIGLPAALTVDQSVIIPISFAPDSPGSKSATLQIVNTQTRTTYQIPLSGTVLPLGEVLVGHGSEDLHLPIYPYFGFSYAQSIYLQSELNISDNRITSLSYYWNGASNAPASNSWTILMAHTPNSEFAGTFAWTPCSQMAMVFSGEVSLPASPGWITIPLDNPFPYNNVDNLLIAIDENEVGYDTSEEYFFCTSSSANRSLRYYSDSTNPDPASPPLGNLVEGFPNLMLTFAPNPSGPPQAVTLQNPAPGTVGMPIEGFDLRWTPASSGGIPTSYRVYLADSAAGITSQHFWETSEQCFNPVSAGQMVFGYGERWYWTVEAINAEGSAILLPPAWFEIEPLISSFPYSVDFEAHANNTLPVGWKRTSLSQGWKTGSNLSSDYFIIPPHSIYAAANDDAAGADQDGSLDLLRMPRLDFSQTPGSPMLSFVSFYPGSYSQLASVEASTDGSTWTTVHSLAPHSVWTPLTVDLSAFDGLNPVFIRFHSNDSGVWASGWAIDNVCISFHGLEAPELSVQIVAGALQLSWNPVDGATSYRVEASPTPLQEDTWTLLTTTTSQSYTYSGTMSPLFFRVSAAATR